MNHWLEYFGVATGFLYLWLEIKQHRAMWIVGLLTSLTYVFVFFFAKIYADMGLNIYYVAISIYGWREWAKGNNPAQTETSNDSSIIYRHTTLPLLVRIVAVIVALQLLIYAILRYLTDSPIPIGDAFTTAVGIVATWMLARRIIEHWLFWVVVNFVSVYLYYLRELYPTMLLYTAYGLLALIGYYTWKKKGIQDYENRL